MDIVRRESGVTRPSGKPAGLEDEVESGNVQRFRTGQGTADVSATRANGRQYVLFRFTNMPVNYYNTVVERMLEELMTDQDISSYCRETHPNGSLAHLAHMDKTKEYGTLAGRLIWNIEARKQQAGEHGKPLVRIMYNLSYIERSALVDGQEILVPEFELTIRPTNYGPNTIPGAYHFKGTIKNEAELASIAVAETKKILSDFGYITRTINPGTQLPAP
ncbi:MAG: hypothetical protein ABIJ08_00805 [Nanoarchaeota archaeon]